MSMTCTSCSSPIPAGAQYCPQCGARVGAQTLLDTSPQLTERKFVTVVFIDMVGSLSVIRDQDPEDAHELLSSALAVMSDAVHAYGGVVIDRQGDGVMAIFGAPAAQEDHAARACHAAMRLHAMVERTLAARIALRVGMNSGEVAVGSARNDFAIDYTATGVAVHIAARLQGVAAPNTTVMSAQTAALVGEAMLTEPIGRVDIKGLAAPLEIHRLVGPATLPHGPAGRMRRNFVGRSAALAAMDEALAAAFEGRGCVLGVSGEAGIGKTALIERFTHRHRHAVTFVHSSAEHHTSVAPFQPFAEMVQRLLGMAELPQAQRRSVIRSQLKALGLDDQTYGPPLLDLLDFDVQMESWGRLAPLARHDRIGSAVIDLLWAASQQRKLVVVLDNLQRADSATIDLVDRIAGAIAGHGLLVVAAFRPELAQRWGRKDGYRHLRLDRLTDDETRSLIAGYFGEAVLPQVEGQLIRWSKGNPLFLRESVRAVVEAGAVADPDAAAAIPIPPSVGAVIAARIDRLAPDVKRALLAASVLGDQFAANVLASVTGLTAAALAAQLEALASEEFVRPLDPMTGTYGFEHGLFREVAYATLLRRQRRDLHQAAYAALRWTGPDITPWAVEELARHAYGGELWADAATLCREAGRRAAARYSNREAALHLENAVTALDHADPDGRQLADAIALRLELRSVSIPLLRLDRIGALLTEADAMAERLGDVAQRVRISAFQAGLAYLTRSPAHCIVLCRTALRLAGPTRDARLRIAPCLYLAQAHYGLGQYRRAIATLGRDMPPQDAELSGEAVGLPVRPLLMRTYWLAIAKAELGQFAAAEALAGGMVSQADPRQPFESLYALTAQGFVRLLRGELGDALQSSASALTIAEHNDIAFILPVLGSQVGYLLSMQGRKTEGLELARRAVRKAEEIGINAGRSRWTARLAEACLIADEVGEARRHARSALDAANDGREQGYLCSALRLHAKLCVAEGKLDQAAADLRDATKIARRLRLGPALAKCHFDAGALALRGGHLTEARRALALAGRSFRSYGMPAATARVAVALARAKAGSSGSAFDDFFGSAE